MEKAYDQSSTHGGIHRQDLDGIKKESKGPKEAKDERHLYIQELQEELLVMVQQQRTERQTRSLPIKQELSDKQKKAEKAAAKVGKIKKGRRPQELASYNGRREFDTEGDAKYEAERRKR